MLRRLLHLISELFRCEYSEVCHRDYYIHEDLPKTYGTKIRR